MLHARSYNDSLIACGPPGGGGAQLLATAHKSLALVAERIRRPPDLPAMARHRRAAWALMGLSPQGTCPICTEDIACDSPGAVTLGCFHIFHR